MSPPGLLSIGHLTRDRQPVGADRPGGAVLYGALAAWRLGLDVAVATAAESLDFALQAFAGTGVRVHCRVDEVTTTFVNRSEDARRRQWLLAVAGPLGLDDVPAPWRSARLVHLGPVAGEVDPALVDALPDAIVVAAAQGWLRCCDATGRVNPAPWPIPAPILQRADAVVLSDEDLGPDVDRLTKSVRAARALVLTHGAAGATLFAGGRSIPIPAIPAAEVDPTGAGDVFAAALLVRLGEGAGLLNAAYFASAAASCSVEGLGTTALPSRSQVLSRLAGAPQARSRGG